MSDVFRLTEGSSLTLLFRLEISDTGELAGPEDVDSLNVVVTDLHNLQEVYDEDYDPADAVLPSAVMDDDRWDYAKEPDGYNGLIVVPATAFADGGKLYRAELSATVDYELQTKRWTIKVGEVYSR